MVIEGVRPQVDEGRFPAKAVLGDIVAVEADIYADGHDALCADLLYRQATDSAWTVAPMRPLGNDRWRADFPAGELTAYAFTIEAWVDAFQTWRRDLASRVEAGQNVAGDLLTGAALIGDAAHRAPPDDAGLLRAHASRLAGKGTQARRAELGLDGDLAALMRPYGDRAHATRYGRDLLVAVDPARAGFSTWYEMFPRSVWLDSPVGQAPGPGGQATFADVERRLPYVAEMGFDVLYFPPVHPIGRTQRKGKNNATRARAGDPGSPWAIGSEEGGHKSIDPQLGTPQDFRRLARKAKKFGIDIALDIAFQCSPDHPYVKEHPQWFKRRPDGSVQHAENPPKKYEDIYPFDFGTPDRQALWEELKSIFLYWIGQGVRIFRVDNPHTKPFPFWEWLIAEVKREQADVILLSEAFTRPKIMYHLAKLGFTQSYTYFAWRNAKQELTDYFTELARTEVSDFFRPHVWPNTPDILTEDLRTGGRPAFSARLVLAATLSANYGIYGPAFELMEQAPREAGSEEYLRSEKYEIKRWDVRRPDSLRGLIARVNRARRENPALQSDRGLRFHRADNDRLICYSKETAGGGNVVITVVNLDYGQRQAGWVEAPVEDWGIAPDEAYQVHDLLSDARYTWRGPRNYVELDPQVAPAHVFRLRRASAGGSGREFE
ncbi:MAG: alpha-1,4-glucan--maltose-1-phosphate maltosyltransferase [Dehalococcoidia bacterium]|nr:alpha-1,4-glucan--maltose-1-phosphate maltosyltransferase [Dehalococcoidia bacterium]